MIRQQEETEQKKENERQRELKLLEFLRQADEIETQYDHLQKEELKLHVQTEKNHELCKEKEAYFEKLRIYEEAGEVYDKIRMQRKEYRDRLSDWQDRYDCNQAGLLARNLIDGHPCPVCGSLHHPKTADFKESDITQEMLRALREETELIDRQYNTAFAKVKQSKGIVEICKEQLCKKSGKRSEEFEKLDEIYEISLRQYKKVKKEFERIKKQKEKIAEQRVKVEKSKEKQLNYVEKLQEIAGKSHEKDSLYKQTEARIEEICKNLEYKTYKDASEEQQRLSDEIDQMKFNKEEIEKKKTVAPIGTKLYKNKIQGLRGKATGLCFNLQPKNIITLEEAKKMKFKLFSIGCDTSYSKESHDKVTLEGIGITADNKCVLLKERTFNNRTIPFAPSDVVQWIVEFMEEFKNEWGFARTCFIDNADQGTIMEANKAKRQNALVYNFENAWKKTKIITRVQLQESWLNTGDFLIVETCKDYIDECNKYSFDEDNQPEDGNDHSINGCQYAWLPHKKKIGNWEVIKKLIKDESEE